ncbi:MAG: ABC transporter permease [Trueperaceae bacterium]
MAITSPTPKRFDGLAPETRSRRSIVWQQFSRSKVAIIGGIILIFLYLAAIFAGFLAPYGLNEYTRRPNYSFHPPTKIHWIDPETGRLTRPFIYPTKSERDPDTLQKVYVENTSEKYPIKFFHSRPESSYTILGLFKSDIHLFGVDEPARIFLWGTNSLGKDVFSRILYGGQVSLTVGLLAVWVSLFLGLLLGGLAGFYGGWVDNLVMRLNEVFDAIPGLFLLIVLSTLLRDPDNPLAKTFGLEMNSTQIYLMIVTVLGFIGWGGLARAVRSIVFSIREQDYAQAAKALGASNMRVIWQHLLPATAGYVIVTLTLAIPGFILAETSLSFFGLGPSETDSASWGMLLKDATDQGLAIEFTPWLLIPGIPIILAVLSWNLVGDGLRDAFDPRKRR